MENFYSDGYSSLELTIAMPGFSSPSLLSSGESGGSTMKEMDIYQVPTSRTEEECMEEEREEEDDEIGPINGWGPARRKKLRLTKEQSRLLEESFRQNHTLNPRERETLAGILRLKPRQVEVWFQNRRARSKLKQTEMECEYLKRWFGSLSDQNRKLHKEVEELRAIKVGAGHRLSPPPSALTMCPRCQRVTATATATSTTSNISHLRHRPQPPATCYN